MVSASFLHEHLLSCISALPFLKFFLLDAGSEDLSRASFSSFSLLDAVMRITRAEFLRAS